MYYTLLNIRSVLGISRVLGEHHDSAPQGCNFGAFMRAPLTNFNSVRYSVVQLAAKEAQQMSKIYTRGFAFRRGKAHSRP